MTLRLHLRRSGLLSLLFLAAVTLSLPAAPVLRVLRNSDAGRPLLQNGDFEQKAETGAAHWGPWAKGFRWAPGEGRAGSTAIACERRENDGEFGASQTLALNQTNIARIVFRGWSKAQEVTGSSDSGYSLYADIIYADGTTSWGRSVAFSCGTHDWERRELALLPDKPIKTLTLHCLFRGHTGKVWFDDVSLSELPAPAGTAFFQGSLVEPTPQAVTRAGKPRQRYSTKDGLEIRFQDSRVTSLKLHGQEVATASPSGFLVRDFTANSDVYAFSNRLCPELGLQLETQVTAQSNHLAVTGRVSDLTGKDRAITLLFALPIEAAGWQWGDDVRASRVIGGSGEFAGTVNVHCGADGKLSRYPLGALWNRKAGLALATDLDKPAQCRLVYHAGTRQFFIAYDFALVKETLRFPSAAEFRFVIYPFSPAWGFRAALQKLYEVFPQQFVRRVPREGVWMPFTDIAKVPEFRDFGFAFQEGAPNVPFDDQNGIASFVYVEPMSHWLHLPPAAPRTYDGAMAVLKQDLAGPAHSEPQRMAAATLASGIHKADGQFSLYLVKAPWCDGGVFTLNPDPDLPGTPGLPFTKASVMRDAIDAAFQKNAPGTNAPGAGLDGVYFDSFEMSASQLNYRREHFPYTEAPLVFDSQGRPAELMLFNTCKFARAVADRLHARGKLTFANAVLWEYSFPAPFLDVLGTEINWLPRGEYQPDTDALMNFRRALCRQKPYCLLLNSDYQSLTPQWVEQYFQRCVFYGIWPGFFDQEAASKDPYWTSSKRYYERDRAFFRKYIPLLQKLTTAGWQPITGAAADNSMLWLERFGEPSHGPVYLTVFNNTKEAQAGEIVPGEELKGWRKAAQANELVTGTPVARGQHGWPLRLPPQSVAVLEWVR